MKTNYTRRGFTLIELLAVVIIIAILAAIALPQYQKAVTKSRATEAKLLVRSIWEALMRKNLEMGTYNEVYNFQDLDVSFTDMNGNKATEASFETKDFTYHIFEGRGDPEWGGFILAVQATPKQMPNGPYFIGITGDSEGKLTCWGEVAPCRLVLPGATLVSTSNSDEDIPCASVGSACFVE